MNNVKYTKDVELDVKTSALFTANRRACLAQAYAIGQPPSRYKNGRIDRLAADGSE